VVSKGAERLSATGRSTVLLDANVVIDLAKLDCLEQVARLAKFALVVVDEVVAEVKQPAQAGALKERNWLQAHGWAVLTFWGRTLLRDPVRCAQEVGDLWRSRLRDSR
jgi:hypothetical protein